ncbi:flavin reductase family protein [Streptomyces sp. Je 1-79]|uniref:flavin reductase family protein n=1 Tax=Streptomyces sp. Je 1-79 TaxID=2943847 RepID=UPI0021A6A03F|nr:flavin reductase family protein [Streptomyces sp. Je 1-79]MCT4356192.1 flavin reductase family protein [Streptomyces sp. Je 1-79]
MSAARTLMHEHETQPIDPRALRRVCGLFVTGVTVITTAADGHAEGTTVNSFTSVSLDPPLVLFCLHRQSRLRKVLVESGGFTVNFLAGRQEKLARAFAGRQPDGFQDVPCHDGQTGLPVLSEALAFLTCRTVDIHDGGDHDIIVGEVVELGVPEQGGDPLIFYAGALGTLDGEAQAPRQAS